MKVFLLLFYCLLNLNVLNAQIIENKRDDVEFTTIVNNDYIYACGEEFMETKCKCQNNMLKCDSEDVSNLNIHIIAENFTVKSAEFKSNGITVLKKKQILPGREYSILKLRFFNNPLTVIENGAFDEFQSLKELDLSYNKLTKIDENVLTQSLGKSLIRLDLNMNFLRLITPKTFMNLKKLEFLGLSNNTALMPYFNKNVFSPSLMNLKILDLTWCNITTLEEDAFENLLNLKEIMLHKNPFTTVPKALNLLQNLEILDLSHTGLITVNKNDFEYNSKLLNLYFYAMDNLTTVNDCAFCELPNLQKIMFRWSYNLTYFHENAFGSFSKKRLYSNLKEFDIGDTNISTISERLIDWSKTDKFHLRTSKYNCDCSMAWLINDLENPLWKSNFISPFGTICANPPEFKGKNITEVAGKICDGKVSSLYRNPTQSSSFNWIQWILLSGIIFGLVILCYIYQNQIIHFINRYRKSQSDDDTNQLFHYRNLEADTVSM